MTSRLNQTNPSNAIMPKKIQESCQELPMHLAGQWGGKRQRGLQIMEFAENDTVLIKASLVGWEWKGRGMRRTLQMHRAQHCVFRADTPNVRLALYLGLRHSGPRMSVHVVHVCACLCLNAYFASLPVRRSKTQAHCYFKIARSRGKWQ
uniref:Uncharacterized protein n=1 Tax=Setaria digitata TaxID=48799 RepID=A0A915PMR8_9BILA